MKYQFIEQHKQEFPVRDHVPSAWSLGKWLLCMAQASYLPAQTRRCSHHAQNSAGLCLSSEVDMGVRAFMPN